MTNSDFNKHLSNIFSTTGANSKQVLIAQLQRSVDLTDEQDDTLTMLGNACEHYDPCDLDLYTLFE